MFLEFQINLLKNLDKLLQKKSNIISLQNTHHFAIFIKSISVIYRLIKKIILWIVQVCCDYLKYTCCEADIMHYIMQLNTQDFRTFIMIFFFNFRRKIL